MPGSLQPLGQQFPIVNPDGTPTLYFIEWAQQKQIDISAGITAAQAQQFIDDWAAARSVIAGDGLTGGGALSADVTIDADASAILDLLSDTQGTVLYRGASGWAGLAPGTSGHFLKTNGAGANPAWAAAGGGSGGVTSWVKFECAAPPVILGSSGISGVTRTNTGRYNIAFSSAFADTNYAIAFHGRFSTTAGDQTPVINIDRRSGFGKNTGSVDITILNNSAATTDAAGATDGFIHAAFWAV